MGFIDFKKAPDCPLKGTFVLRSGLLKASGQSYWSLQSVPQPAVLEVDREAFSTSLATKLGIEVPAARVEELISMCAMFQGTGKPKDRYGKTVAWFGARKNEKGVYAKSELKHICSDGIKKRAATLV